MKEKELTFEEEQQMLYERMQAESPRELTKDQEEQGRQNRKKIEEYRKKMKNENKHNTNYRNNKL